MSQVNRAITNKDIQVSSVYKAQSDAFGLLDYPFLLDMIDRNGTKKVLDVGTGEGSFILELAQRAANVRFDAIDLNKDLVEIGKVNNEILGLDINFQHATFGENFTGSNYDLIIARFAVEHIVELSDIDSFIFTTYEKLKENGWLVIIEYYVHELDINDPTWSKFRTNELATYKSIKAHPRIALELPERLRKAGYDNIRSSINHISPSTIGAEFFFRLVQEYTKIYAQIAPGFWTNELIEEILSWCNKRHPKGEPLLFTSYTTGQKAFASSTRTGQ